MAPSESLPYLVVLGVVAFTAVAQATNLVVNAQLIRAGFHLPFTLLWYTGCTKAALGVPKFVDLCRGRRHHNNSDDPADPLPPPRSLLDELISVKHQRPDADPSGGDWTAPVPVVERRAVVAELVCLMVLFVLYVVANAGALVAVSTLSAGVFSAIFSTAPAFVCLFSRLLLRRPFALPEAVAIVVSFAGMLCVAKPWAATAPDLGATIAAVLSPIAAAAYTVYFSWHFTNIGWRDVGFVLSKLALVIFVIGGALLGALVAAGVEPPVWQHDFSVTEKALLAACAATGWLFNGGINYAVTITYPLFVSVGGELSTVLVVIATGVLDDVWPDTLQWFGMALIGSGFVVLASVDLIGRRRSQRERLNSVDDGDMTALR